MALIKASSLRLVMMKYVMLNVTLRSLYNLSFS